MANVMYDIEQLGVSKKAPVADLVQQILFQGLKVELNSRKDMHCGKGFLVHVQDMYVSVQFSNTHYCSNRWECGENTPIPELWYAVSAEIAVIIDKQFTRLEGWGDCVKGWVPLDEVYALIVDMNERPEFYKNYKSPEPQEDEEE